MDGYGLTGADCPALAGLLGRRARAMYDLLRRGARDGVQPWARIHAEDGVYWRDTGAYLDAHVPCCPRHCSWFPALLGAGGARAEVPAGPAPTRRDAALVRDIEIPVPRQPAVRAYLVRPAHPGRPDRLAGVLALHWFEPGRADQDRTEFLAEATALAGRGVVSVLPQLTFPWAADPVGDARDRAAVSAQLDAVGQAWRRLLAEPGVDPARTAVVGHDYGAMYAADLAAREPGVRTAVLLAPDATWANWFDLYWLRLPAGERAAYRAVFAGLDPVDVVGRLGAGAYLQFAAEDRFVGPTTRVAFAAAAPDARVSLYPGEEHDLGGTRVRDDRVAWLADRLALAG